MSQIVEGQRISLPWALVCTVGSLLMAIALNETFAPGHGKAIFLGVFVTAFIAKTFSNSLGQAKVLGFLAVVAAFHITLVFLLPNDNQYPGGLLFPAGVVDIGVFYLLFGLIAKRT